MNDFQKSLIDTALSMGAIDAKIFKIGAIAFDSRTLLKCLYGCSGGMQYCPAARDTSSLIAYSDMIKKYEWGIIICTDDLETGQSITLELERAAFLEGYYFALAATECVNCEVCGYEEGKPCADKKKQRPPLYALGIDVYKTVRGLGWELDVVKEKDGAAKNITAVFVE